jgi:hypothetical protein
MISLIESLLKIFDINSPKILKSLLKFISIRYSNFSDFEILAAVRLVSQGKTKTLLEHFPKFKEI